MIARLPDRSRWCLPLLWLLASGCDDAHVVACVGDQDFCRRVITANVPPEADAGDRQEVAGGDEVTLNGSGSTDPDGRITSYSWTQLAGTAVTLTGSSEAIATFAAPDVTDPETLTFRLTVVDDDRAAAEDDVTVEVVPVVAVATRAGIRLLSAALAPAPVLAPERCSAAAPLAGSAWFVHSGLWLSALSGALQGDASPDDVTRFLDAARVLLAWGEQQAPAAPVAKSIWRHGLDALQHFALDRDPALADWAVRLQPPAADGTLAARLRRGEITLTLASGEPLVITLDPARATEAAVTSVRRAGCHSGLDPIRLAADTIFLLEQLPARMAR